MEAYTQEAFVVSRLVDTIPTRSTARRFLGIAGLTDGGPRDSPGHAVSELGFGEDYIETPSTTKRGFIVPVTKEAIFFDRTHLVLSRAAEVGEMLGLNKEKRLIDLVIGATNNYKWNGTTYNTYQAGDAPWINVNDRQRAGRLDQRRRGRAAVRRHPRSQHGRAGAGHRPPRCWSCRPIVTRPMRVFNALEVRFNPAPPTPRPLAANPLVELPGGRKPAGVRRVMASGAAADDAKKWWFMGDFQKAFAYMENWPITVTQSPQGSEADFNQDIVVRFKASERGAAAVLNPRYVVKCTG